MSSIKCKMSNAVRRMLLTFTLLLGVVHFQSSMFNVQCSIGDVAAQTNELSIGNVSFPAGKTAIIPIELTNQSDICGVQFEIGLPYQLSMVTDENTGASKLPFYLNQSRASGCDMVVKAMSSGTTYMYYNNGSSVYKYVYRVIITSVDNTPIKGSSGTLLTIEMPLPETLENGAELWSMFRDNKIILSDREGNQVATSTKGTWGIITVEVIPRPDLIPSHVSVTQALANPGDQLDFSWKVENIGDEATGAGWTEKLFLENENNTRVYVGTTSYDGTLEIGGSVDRQFSVNLDEYPGISGYCRPVVQILPVAGCGEIPVNQGNNTATGGQYSLMVKKFLILTPYKNLIPENGTGTYNCELRRTGDLSEAQTFKVTTRDLSGNTNRLIVSDAKFTAQSNKTYISLQPVNNTSVNPDQRIAVVVNELLNNGYDCVIDTVYVEDDDLIPLSLILDKSEYNEGDVMHVTASVPERYYPDEELYVYLTIEQSKRFKLPQRIAFEHGATTATIDIPVLQDKNPANTQSIKLTGTANHHQKAEVLFILNDDDTPAIEMTLTPTTISEGAGVSAMLGTITRTGVTNNQITIKLTDDGKGDIYYSTTSITMPAGTATVNFPLGVRDNAKVDGDRTVNVTAAIYISSCNCDAIGDKQTSVTIPITITDDDGPALSVTTNKATIMEGDATGATLTISRNTTDNTEPLTVTITHDATDVTCPTTATIPAGATSTTIPFVAQSNALEEGDRTVSIMVGAEGYSTGSAWLLISDRTLPDLVLEVEDISGTEVKSGNGVTFNISIANIGSAPMRDGSTVKVFQDGKTVASYTFSDNIAAGETVTCYIGLVCPALPGTYNYVVKVNDDQSKPELLYTNNSSKSMAVTVKSKYTYEIVSDKTIYNEKETVTLSGRLVGFDESIIVSDFKVEPYIVFNGSRTKLKATTNESGRFTVTYELPAGFKGHFTYGVCEPDENKSDVMGEFDVLGFERVVDETYIKHNLFVGEPYVGKIRLRNLTQHALHNLSAAVDVGTHTGYAMLVQNIDELPGDGYVDVDYSIICDEISTGNEWDIVELLFTCDEGASYILKTYNYTRVHEPKLKADVTSINTTVTKGQSRTYPIILTNMGMGETGTITIDMPSGLSQFVSLVTPATIPSMQPGDSTKVMLRFNPGDMALNLIQKGSIAINCEKGSYVQVYFNVKVVSESKGSLRVQVRDENTIYGNKDGEKPYVKGANVQLKDYNTGAIVAQGTTPDDTDAGILFENINEGYYQLYVTADKHDSYSQNIMVNPGETTTHLATISYQAVSVSWDVVETEVDDEYEIVATVNYETQVPVPVIRMTMPDTIVFSHIKTGQSTLFNIVLRNDGLIAAQNVNVELPTVKGYTLTPLVEAEGFTIGTQQSRIIPVRITNTSEAPYIDGGGSSGGGGGGTPGGGGDDTPGGGGGDTPGGGGDDTPGGGGGDTPGGGGGGTPGGGGGGSTPGGGGDDAPGDDGGDDVPCTIKVKTGYSWPCGEDSKYGWLEAYVYTHSEEEYDCLQDIPIKTMPGSSPGTGPGSPYDPNDKPKGGTGSTGSITWAQWTAMLCLFMECNPNGIPGDGCWATGAKIHQNKGFSWDDAAGCAGSLIGGNLGTGLGAASTLRGCTKMADKIKGNGGTLAPKRFKASASDGETKEQMPDLVASYYYKLSPLYEYMYAYIDLAKIQTEAPKFIEKWDTYNTPAVLDSLSRKLDELHEAGLLYEIDTLDIPTMIPISMQTGGNGGSVSGVRRKSSELAKSAAYKLVYYMPNWRSTCEDFNLRRYVDRMQNNYRILDGLEPLSDNYVTSEQLQKLIDRQDSCLQVMTELGFVDWKELVASANKDRLEYYENASNNTCATVKLELEQKLVLTRQAFRGTLTVDNNTTKNLTGVSLSVAVENMLGVQATSHEFQINFESITGFEGSTEGPWTLAPKTKGVATILFIPTKYAAPDTLTTYAFGGNLSFKDGDGAEQYRELTPVKLQVKPSPELDLTYFMQRDVYGDNPLTEDVEPVIPSEFSVLIHNKGKGDATNVRMMTKQPKIIENAKGLSVEFAIVSSSLNGGEKAMALDESIATQFGDIPAGGCSYATWDLTCSLLGHFTSYDVSATHVTSYGNPDLSLLDEVTIHELIHSVNARFGEQQYRAWVCNDVEDGHSEPDHIYFSNGENADLKTLSATTTVTSLGDSKWRIRVTVPQSEWFYTAVADPTGGSSKILSIKDENTGEDVDPENFWTTQWTMQDGFDPLRENKLHIVDYANEPKTFSYVVEFEPTPEVRLDVVSIETVPNDSEIAETVIDQLTVTFNKGIDTSTFTNDDIVLRYEGEKQTTELPITMVEKDSIFHLNTSALSENGYYVLQVKTENIRDKEGFLGYNGKQVKWMLFKDGLVHYNVAPWPSTGGSVTTSTGTTNGSQKYGNSITMTATASAGYTFSYWAVAPTFSASAPGGGVKGMRYAPSTVSTDIDEGELERFSTEPSITVEMNKAYNLYAVFKPISYRVNIVMPTEVGDLSIGSGNYDYGTVLKLKASANEGYRILGFVVDEDMENEVDGDEYEHTVTGDATIVVDYKDLAPVSIVLQDTKDYDPVAVELANVKLQRSFRKGTWNTICLPFAIPHPDEVFGTGTKVARLTGLEDKLMKFTQVNHMLANVPYIIKPGSLISNTLVANGESKISFFDILGTSIEEPGEEGPIDDTGEGVEFVGSYKTVMVAQDAGNYYISSDILYYVDAAANVPTGRFRGYFHTALDGLTKRMGMQVDDSFETAIFDVAPMLQPLGSIYSIDGRMVRSADADRNSLLSLPSGMYLINGKKVLIK